MAAITSVVVGAVGLGYGIYAGEKAKKDQKEQIKKQEKAQAALVAEAEKEQDSEKQINDLERARDGARTRQKNAAKRSKGRSSTILAGASSARGVIPQVNGNQGGKTLIGL